MKKLIDVTRFVLSIKHVTDYPYEDEPYYQYTYVDTNLDTWFKPRTKIIRDYDKKLMDNIIQAWAGSYEDKALAVVWLGVLVNIPYMEIAPLMELEKYEYDYDLPF